LRSVFPQSDEFWAELDRIKNWIADCFYEIGKIPKLFR
jgi:hypothetical protein